MRSEWLQSVKGKRNAPHPSFLCDENNTQTE
nr:MAG TPA: hypothetical protein [Caudoviricetes sp.]